MVATQFLLGDAFLASQNLPPDLPFDHVEFIARTTTFMYIKLIHLGWRVWSVFLLTTILAAAIAGLWHKLSGNMTESTVNIFTDDPNNNELFTYVFQILGFVLIIFLNYAFHSLDATFVRLTGIAYDKKFSPKRSVSNSNDSRESNISMTEPFLSSLGEEIVTPIAKVPVYKGKSLWENCCPCFSSRANKDKYRSAFYFSAPDFTMRLYQVASLYLGLLISLFITVFMFVENSNNVFWTTLFPLLMTLSRFGFQSPKFSCLRYFGPLAPPEILDPLVAEAREKYAAGVRRINIASGDHEIIRKMYLIVLKKDSS